MLMVNQLAGFGVYPSAAVDATISYRTTATDTTGASTWNFASQDIGTAASGRRVIVGFHSLGASSRSFSGGGLTVGGNAATQIAFVEGSGGGVFVISALYIIQVDSGTTATITPTLSGAVSRAAIGVWAAYDLLSSTATDSGTSTANPGTYDLDISAGGVAVAVSTPFQTGADPTTTWANLTEKYDAALLGGGGGGKTGASDAFAAAQTNLTISATRTGFTSGAFVAASFR